MQLWGRIAAPCHMRPICALSPTCTAQHRPAHSHVAPPDNPSGVEDHLQQLYVPNLYATYSNNDLVLQAAQVGRSRPALGHSSACCMAAVHCRGLPPESRFADCANSKLDVSERLMCLGKHCETLSASETGKRQV